ncbi:MAG: hypothetical protein WCK11_04215, partial [Candidatus Falkowbacteria bacterium]
MNVSELARILRLPPQELREKLPQLGFHIGFKAIKVDDRTAQKIISQWPTLSKKFQTGGFVGGRQSALANAQP